MTTVTITEEVVVVTATTTGVALTVTETPVEVTITGGPGPQGPTGEGVPTGGTTGQVLAKASSTDYDTEWVVQSGGGTTQPSIANATTGTEVTTINLILVALRNYGVIDPLPSGTTGQPIGLLLSLTYAS